MNEFLPREIVSRHILTKCENKDLVNLRLVSKEYRTAADNESLYKPYDLQIKKTLQSLINVKEQVELNKKDLESKEKELESISAKIRTLRNSTQNWFGYFVSILNAEICVFLKIKSLFCWISPSVAKECQKQLNMPSKIMKLQNKRQSCESELSNLYVQKHAINRSYKEISYNYKLIEADDKIKDLFGGRKAFENLPVLDINDRQDETRSIDYIYPTEMSGPIVRGQDRFGREFVTIRAKNYSGERECQTFFKRYKDEPNWSSKGSIIDCPEYKLANGITVLEFMIADGTVNEKASEALKQFLTKKKNEHYQLC